MHYCWHCSNRLCHPILIELWKISHCTYSCHDFCIYLYSKLPDCDIMDLPITLGCLLCVIPFCCKVPSKDPQIPMLTSYVWYAWESYPAATDQESNALPTWISRPLCETNVSHVNSSSDSSFLQLNSHKFEYDTIIFQSDRMVLWRCQLGTGIKCQLEFWFGHRNLKEFKSVYRQQW